MSEAPRLFRDFVEKLERAYIAFDGVVGSCLGRAWGGTNHGAEGDDVDVIPRNSESNIAERASFSYSINLLRCPFTPVPRPLRHSLKASPAVSKMRVLFFPLIRHSVVRSLARRAKEKFNIYSSIRLQEKSLSLFLFSVSIVSFPALSFFFSSTRSRAISILGWVNAYSKQRPICRYF